jgi:dihydrofolate reductase
MIAAVSANGVLGIIGSDGKPAIPWNYPADMAYFRETTKGSTVIFGRKTFESIGRPLPKRRNVVISSTKVEMEGIETFHSLGTALEIVRAPVNHPFIVADDVNQVIMFQPNIWLAGGAGIYQEGMKYVEEIHLTVLEDIVNTTNAVRFPFINPRLFEVREWRQLTPGDDTLRLYIYKRV